MPSRKVCNANKSRIAALRLWRYAKETTGYWIIYRQEDRILAGRMLRLVFNSCDAFASGEMRACNGLVVGERLPQESTP